MPWSWWGPKSDTSNPTEALNPELKDFLETQQPRPYKPADAPKVAQAPVVAPPAKDEPPDAEKVYNEHSVPAESLYQDGRYAHLWKTYTPQGEITRVTKSAIDRISDAKADRKKTIHRAALENCAFEEEIRQQCLAGVTMASRFKGTLTMCNDETKQYNRCYQLQAKFLQALGYMSSSSTSEEHEERVQMHADKLYHRMMDYEADVEEAKRNKLPIPALTSIFDSNRPAPTADQLDMPEAAKARLSKPLNELPAHERELVHRAALEEAAVKRQVEKDFLEHTASMEGDRMKRQASLAKIFGDPIAKALIPDAGGQLREATSGKD